MIKGLIFFLLLEMIIEFSNGYEYPKPELKFDKEDRPACPEKRRVVRGVFFYTYDDNYDGREIEMHELNLQTYNKLISSKEYVKPPAALKTTYDIFSFFDGRCEASINCKKITDECPTTVKPTPPPETTTTKPWPSNSELQKEVSNIYSDFAPYLKESEIEEIMTSLRNMNEFTKYWTADQVDKISTKNSFIVQDELVKQNTSGKTSVMRFSDEIKQLMIKYTQEINPNLSLEETLQEIGIVEEIGTAHMRYLTLDQYKGLRGEVVGAFANNTEIHGFVSTTHAPTTTTKKSTTTKTTTTTKKPTTTTTEKPTTTTTKKQTTARWPSHNDLQKQVTDIYYNYAPHLTEPQIKEIMTSYQHINEFTKYWTAPQLDEIATRNSLIVQSQLVKQNTSGTASVMRFSDEIKKHMINYTKEIDPSMSIKEIQEEIVVVEEIGTSHMRYLTLDEFKSLRADAVAAFVNNTIKNGYITKAPVQTTTSRPSTTTSTIKSTTATKTYIPPSPGASRKPYTRWTGTYRPFTGQYSFGYTWKPFTGGLSWKSRPYTTGTTTTTERYRQRSLINELNPVGNNE